VGGRTAAIAAGLVAALAPPLLFNDGVTLSEPLSLLLMLGAVLLLLDGRDVAAAVTTGLLMLTRPSAQALAVVLALWMLHSFGWRRALRFVLVAVTVVTPWIGRNYVELGSPLLVTSNGFNLAATYSPFVFAHNGFLDPFYAPEFRTVRYQHFTEPELDSVLRRYALRDLRAHPHDLGWHVKRNVRGWLEINANENDSAERIDGRPIALVHDTLPLFFVTLVVGAIGLWLGRRRRANQLLLLVGGYFAVASLVTVAAPRLRAPVDVVIYVGAGVAIAASLRRFGSRDNEVPPWRGRDAVEPRPSDPRRNRMLVGGLAGALVVVIGITLALRQKVEHDARDKARTIAIEARREIDAVAAAYPVDANAVEPKFDPSADAEPLYKLDGELWALLPQTNAHDRPRVRRAAETLYDAYIAQRMLSLTLVRLAFSQPGWKPVDAKVRYESKIRHDDPTLPTFDHLLAGTSAREAVAALAELRR
jgi:hypothetical protein